mgnify:CR=1 FL=1|tara:strand:- start:1125 stop:2687 length:1563 start_codon:yes stop_codon:yes gene_type:complete
MNFESLKSNTSKGADVSKKDDGVRDKSQAAQLKDNRPIVGENDKLKDMTSASLASDTTAQMKDTVAQNAQKSLIQKKESNTGLPNDIRSGVERLSGLPMDDVNVHYNSNQPAQLNAHAYAQGTDIHISPGQEKHLPHEAWHVVQQKQGRVKPTTQLKDKVNINNDVRLENEADSMGEKALKMGEKSIDLIQGGASRKASTQFASVTQRNLKAEVSDITTKTKEKDLSNSYEINPLQDDKGKDKPIPFLGGVLKVKGDPTKGEGEFEYEHSLFQMSGTRKANDATGGFDYEGKGGPLPLKQEAKGKIPIAPIPLGIPGLFAEIAITAEASASVVGNGGIKFKQDQNKKFIPGSLDFIAASVEAKLEAKCGIEGGVTAGVPGLAGVFVGGYGELGAELKGSLEIANYDDPNDPAGHWQMSASIEGEAKGAAGVVAKANMLIWGITKKIPLAEGVFGKFEGKVENQPFTLGGLKEMAMIHKHCAFKRNSSEKAKQEAAASAEGAKEPTEEPKKRSIFNRIFSR